jgi:DNA-binding MarR family transcriptional regulator
MLLGFVPVQGAVMGIIKDEGPLSISEIARRLLIPKPQMTHVVMNGQF